MKKIILVFLTIVFFITQITAQENKTAFDVGLSYKFYQENPNINVQLGYSWKLKKGFFYKVSFYGGYDSAELIEQGRFRTNNIPVLDGDRWDNIELGISLQGNSMIIAKEKILVYGGWRTGYQFIINRTDPMISESFSETIKKNILSISGVLGVNWILENDFYCNIEIPIQIGQMQLEYYRIDNSWFFGSEERRRTSFDLGIRTMAKIGVGTYF